MSTDFIPEETKSYMQTAIMACHQWAWYSAFRYLNFQSIIKPRKLQRCQIVRRAAALVKKPTK